MCMLNKHNICNKRSDTYHPTIVSMKEIHNFLRVVMPKVNIATVTAADNKLTLRTVEVDSLHCKQTTTASILPNHTYYSAVQKIITKCSNMSLSSELF